MGLGLHGRGDDEGAPRGGKKTGPSPVDRGKLGTKRSIPTEADGVPIGLAVAGANRHDKKLVIETLESIPIRRPRPTEDEPQGICLDKGYDYDDTLELVAEFGYRAHIRWRCEERWGLRCKVQAKARRWVVERTHSWLNRFRRILIRWEKKPENYVGMLHLALGVITWRSAGLFA